MSQAADQRAAGPEEGLGVLFAVSEMIPLAKTGGLADVAGALPGSLKGLGLDVRVFVPAYRSLFEGGFRTRRVLEGLRVPLGKEELQADVLEVEAGTSAEVYAVQREDLFDRPNLYRSSRGDYYDNLERFAFFSHAVLSAAEAMGLVPDVVHCHDWQTGLIPALLKGPYARGPLSRAGSVFTIHNLGYQGLFAEDKFYRTGLERDRFYHPEGMEFWGGMSLLKAGIVYSDAVTTVSPTYAREIQTAELGMGMEGVLEARRDRLYGILNGADYERWDPRSDSSLTFHYGPGGLEGKRRCKSELIKEMGLQAMPEDRPLLAVISRLDEQKGLDLLLEVLDEVMELHVGLVVLGSGERRIESFLRESAAGHQGVLGLKIGFDEALAHRIMAGADILLVPSRYEPCGLTQIYALRYGTVPVVRATGGLDDTVEAYSEGAGTGNGFKFKAYDSQTLLAEVKKAVGLFERSEEWQRLVENGMRADFSWQKAAKAYLDIYKEMRKVIGPGGSGTSAAGR
ncbi:MAG: glycogen synthase GlgA [Desulfobacteraceae bacterium]